MDAKKSKFDYGSFNGGYHHFAVNAAKYTKEEAEKIYHEEYNFADHPYIVEKAHVKWRAGINEDHEPCVGWWFDYSPSDKRSVEVWAFKNCGRESMGMKRFSQISKWPVDANSGERCPESLEGSGLDNRHD